jgi:hypothetical protein
MKKDYSRERDATITPMQEGYNEALNQPGLRMVMDDGGLSCGSIDCSAVLVLLQTGAGWYLRRSGGRMLELGWGSVRVVLYSADAAVLSCLRRRIESRDVR